MVQGSTIFFLSSSVCAVIISDVPIWRSTNKLELKYWLELSCKVKVKIDFKSSRPKKCSSSHHWKYLQGFLKLVTWFK